MKKSDQLMLCPFCKAPIIALSAINKHLLNHSGSLRGWCQECKRPIIKYADDLFMAVDKPREKD